VTIGWTYYAITLLVFFGVNVIACWALDLQFGTTGILNFGFIVFQAAGAYTAAVLTLGPPAPGGFETYFFGASLPWPLPWIMAMAVGGVLALGVGAFALRPARRDYQAMSLLIVSVIVTLVVSSKTQLLNGTNGLSGIPKPFASLNLDLVSYGWLYVGLTLLSALGVCLLVRRLKRSPWGTRLKAIRDNPDAAAALGSDVRKETLTVFVVGGMLAALSGAVLVQFIAAWAPDSWTYPETFGYLTAIVVGGAGSTLGVALGAGLVQGIITESVTFLPGFSAPQYVASVQWILIGLLVIGFLWWRPQGLIPERPRTFRRLGTESGERQRVEQPASGISWSRSR
jgi:branched-chain amino acid transport system permease protein